MLTVSNYNDRFNPLRSDTTFPVKLISLATHKSGRKGRDPGEDCSFVGILGRVLFDTFSYKCLQFWDVLLPNNSFFFWSCYKEGWINNTFLQRQEDHTRSVSPEDVYSIEFSFSKEYKLPKEKQVRLWRCSSVQYHRSRKVQGRQSYSPHLLLVLLGFLLSPSGQIR